MASILVVDDEVSVVRVLSIWLERNGYDVFTACNGSDALAQMETESIDLLITDMNMPYQDGVEIIKIVRDKMNKELPIFLLTARCDQEKLVERLKQYSVHVYPKPFVPSRLVEEINRLLGAVTL